MSILMLGTESTISSGATIIRSPPDLPDGVKFGNDCFTLFRVKRAVPAIRACRKQREIELTAYQIRFLRELEA